jgi:hypothetical protein
MHRLIRNISLSKWQPAVRLGEKKPGLLSKIRKFLDPDTSDSVLRKDQQNNPLSESNNYKYSVRDISEQEKPIAHTFTGERQQMREYEEQLGNLEKVRLRELDKALGTNTYFDESKPYEERISSEIIMERKILRKIKEQHQETVLDKVFAYDPQEKRNMPKIRNFKQFIKDIEGISKRKGPLISNNF